MDKGIIMEEPELLIEVMVTGIMAENNYENYFYMVTTTPACTWWNRPEEDLSSGKLESTHPSRTVVKSIEVFYGVESVVRGNADSFLN